MLSAESGTDGHLEQVTGSCEFPSDRPPERGDRIARYNGTTRGSISPASWTTAPPSGASP